MKNRREKNSGSGRGVGERKHEEGAGEQRSLEEQATAGDDEDDGKEYFKKT